MQGRAERHRAPAQQDKAADHHPRVAGVERGQPADLHLGRGVAGLEQRGRDPGGGERDRPGDPGADARPVRTRAERTVTRRTRPPRRGPEPATGIRRGRRVQAARRSRCHRRARPPSHQYRPGQGGTAGRPSPRAASDPGSGPAPPGSSPAGLVGPPRADASYAETLAAWADHADMRARGVRPRGARGGGCADADARGGRWRRGGAGVRGCGGARVRRCGGAGVRRCEGAGGDECGAGAHRCTATPHSSSAGRPPDGRGREESSRKVTKRAAVSRPGGSTAAGCQRWPDVRA
jgi:hypothetical protein